MSLSSGTATLYSILIEVPTKIPLEPLIDKYAVLSPAVASVASITILLFSFTETPCPSSNLTFAFRT